jgi:SNF2 family DNA or RNA helicase
MSKVKPALRDHESWSGHKRSYWAIAPTCYNLQQLIKPADLADQMNEANMESSEERIFQQVKRRRRLDKTFMLRPRPVTSFDIIANQINAGLVPTLPQVKVDPTEDKTLSSQEEWSAMLNNNEFMPPNQFHLSLCTPFQLYPHQVQVIEYAIARENMVYCGIRGSILALEMGLGKTLISLCIIMSQWTNQQGATLVIVPKTLMTNYMMDIARFFGRSVRALVWDRAVLEDRFFDFSTDTYTKNHVIICSYDTVLGLAKGLGILSRGKGGNKRLASVAQNFFNTPWHRIVCDESHRFANSKSQLWEALSKLKPGLRMCLTGTAVRNYEDDLFSQLVFCGLNILPETRKWTIQNYQHHHLGEAVKAMSLEESHIVLPEKKVATHYCELSEPEKQVYNHFMKRCSTTMAAFKKKETNFAHLLEMFTRLRQVCISPYLLDPSSKNKRLTQKEKVRLEPGSILGPELVDLEMNFVRKHEHGMRSGKMIEMIKLTETVAQGEKALIFCQWSSGVLLARDALIQKYGEKAVEIVTGDTKDRDAVFGRFKVDSILRFLVMTRVGGQGVTLTEANHVILMDLSWTDVHNAQAIGRVHRIGQKRPCFVYELVVRGSIESKMVTLCKQKHNIREILMGQGVNAEVIAEFIGEKM